MPRQASFTVVPNPLGMQGLMTRPVDGPESKPPMTSKQAKKLYLQKTRQPRMSKAEQRRIELAEQERIRKELEKDKQANKARMLRERKKEKERKVIEEKKKKGLPLVDVRPSQDTIARFFRGNGQGKKRDSGGAKVDLDAIVENASDEKENNPPVKEDSQSGSQAKRRRTGQVGQEACHGSQSKEGRTATRSSQSSREVLPDFSPPKDVKEAGSQFKQLKPVTRSCQSSQRRPPCSQLGADFEELGSQFKQPHQTIRASQTVKKHKSTPSWQTDLKGSSSQLRETKVIAAASRSSQVPVAAEPRESTSKALRPQINRTKAVSTSQPPSSDGEPAHSRQDTEGEGLRKATSSASGSEKNATLDKRGRAKIGLERHAADKAKTAILTPLVTAAPATLKEVSQQSARNTSSEPRPVTPPRSCSCGVDTKRVVPTTTSSGNTTPPIQQSTPAPTSSSENVPQITLPRQSCQRSALCQSPQNRPNQPKSFSKVTDAEPCEVIPNTPSPVGRRSRQPDAATVATSPSRPSNIQSAKLRTIEASTSDNLQRPQPRATPQFHASRPAMVPVSKTCNSERSTLATKPPSVIPNVMGPPSKPSSCGKDGVALPRSSVLAVYLPNPSKGSAVATSGRTLNKPLPGPILKTQSSASRPHQNMPPPPIPIPRPPGRKLPPPKFATPRLPQTRQPRLLQQIASAAQPAPAKPHTRSPQQENSMPTSTQLFLLSNVDLFPTASQADEELRELPKSQSPYKSGATRESPKGLDRSASFSLDFFSTQDLVFSTQDVLEIEQVSESPRPSRVSQHAVSMTSQASTPADVVQEEFSVLQSCLSQFTNELLSSPPQPRAESTDIAVASQETDYGDLEIPNSTYFNELL